MKKFFAFIVLMCLIGNSALAQNGFYSTETIDFSTYGGSGRPNVGLTFYENDNHPQIDGKVVSERLTVETTGDWGFWGSDTFNETYLQRQDNNNPNNGSSIYISGMKAGDVVTVWGENGNNDGYLVTSVTGDSHLTFDTNTPSHTFTMASDGTLTLTFYNRYSGLRKITITSRVSHFDYDPGYEEYDMYDEFSENDPDKEYNNGEFTGSTWHTSYTLSDEETGITLNGNAAQYIILSGSKNTANNRIAIDPSDDWRFNYGLRAPNNGKWANFSICNLREGDRVVFSYCGTAPVFSSVAGGTEAPTGPYNGSNAFFDKYNDGVFDEGEDIYITPGATPETDWWRYEGNFYIEDHNGQGGGDDRSYPLHYTRYVVTEDGHLDFAIAPDTRIVKIKIYSDHQATMIDEYDADWYTAKFDITGELQANEHIVPGGLEVHVGSNDASQHAHVVTSAHGPVSIVNAVDGFKLPGMSRGDDGELQFVFDLQNNIPETGTFYKFIPLEDGQMKLTFQAANMNYYTYGLNGDETYVGYLGSYNEDPPGWLLEWDRPNEQTVNVSCPYYLVKIDERGNKTVKTYTLGNGDEYTIGKGDVNTNRVIDVKVGETYYLYGGWNGDVSQLSYTSSGQGQNNIEYFPYGAGNGGEQKACGVAKLLEVDFNPSKKIYPLAKWVPNGTIAVNANNTVPNPDTFEAENYLADLWGYNDQTSLTVKKMTGNIQSCRPYLVDANGPGEHNHYRLMIDGITFDGSKDKGGTILIKIGDATVKSSPVFALTIAYSGNPDYDGNSGAGTRGHIWDYSSNTLQGLDYDPVITSQSPGQPKVYSHNAANPVTYGQYFADYFAADISNYSSKDEVLENLSLSGSGLLYDEISSGNSDWMFNYNLQNAGKVYDPVFSNKYDLEGDNADLIWNTEGTVLKTSANSSVMFNEFKGEDVHQSTTDPDRYVGILKGGEFRIPWLMKDDRVIIYMGVGKGAFNDQAVFSIKNARDAVYNSISPDDEYTIGGSHWDGDKEDPYYRGCYHFFATGNPNDATKPADMVFKMTGGNLCKIYSIQIYRGDRIYTNFIDGDPFYQVSTKDDNADAVKKNTWTLRYFGKDEQLANYSGRYYQMNDISASTGQFASDLVLTNNTDENGKVVSFSYTGKKGDIGTIRVRAKDMEKNLNFVADFAEHNVTIAYQETNPYPYTWDFTDVNTFSGQDVGNEWTVNNDKVQNSIPIDSHYNLSLWDENGSMRLNSQAYDPDGQNNIFESNSEQSANQLWAKHVENNEATGMIIPETRGLWFYMDDNDPANNGKMQITSDGLNLEAANNGWCYKMVVPDVPAGGAVYLRVHPDGDNAIKKYRFGSNTLADIADGTTCRYLQTGDGTGDYIVAIKNTGSQANLTLALNGYILKKMGVSTDPKAIGQTGYATESRARDIDYNLTAYLTGKDIRAYTAAISEDYTKVVLTRFGAQETGAKILPAAEDGDLKGCILYHNGGTENNDGTTNRTVSVLDDGFHVFVPDMHDKDISNYLVSTTSNQLKAFEPTKDSYTHSAMTSTNKLSQTDGSKTNLILSAKKMYNGQDYGNGYDVFFIRPVSGGATLKKCSAYIQIPTSKMIPLDGGDGNAKMSIVFEDDPFIDNQDISTTINDALQSDQTINVDNAEWYNLNGQKLKGKPTSGGLYIMNGKKVLVK